MKMTVEKAKYESPKLNVFGSVRNLTGGSATRFRDGANDMRF